MENYFIVDQFTFTEEYLDAVAFILKRAGYKIQYNKEGDLKIYIPEDFDMASALDMFRMCALV